MDGPSDLVASCEYPNKQSRTSSGGCTGCGEAEQLLDSVEFLPKTHKYPKDSPVKASNPAIRVKIQGSTNRLVVPPSG